MAFLKAQPTLVLDTKHFDQEFNDRLLASFDDLDEISDGLLVHGENFQALNLLIEKYRKEIKCIYIDPPYNTGSDEFIYKDNYRHSCWISMMADRLLLGRELMREDGVIFVSCDFHEYENLQKVMNLEYGEDNRVATFHFKVRHEGRILTGDKEVQEVMEQVVSYKKPYFEIAKIELPERFEEYCYKVIEEIKHPNTTIIGGKRMEIFEAGQYQILKETPDTSLLKWISVRGTIRKGNSSGRFSVAHIEGRYKPGTLLKVEGIGDDGLGYRYFLVPKEARDVVYFQGCPLTRTVRKKPFTTFYDFVDQFNNVGYEGDVDFRHGKKPVALILKLLEIGSIPKDAFIVDFFAGSGTTAHAVINQNRQDNGRRKYILVEIGDYFDTVLLPRIKKALFSPEWKEGKPVRRITDEEIQRSPRIVKYIRLESYEDTLNNITFSDTPKTLYDFDDYLLKYMLAWETKESETLLNVDRLASPFSYKLTITNGQEAQQKPVDIPETFAYLLGLNVKTRRIYHDKDHRYLVYRGSIDHREVVVIWHETAGWEKTDYERDKEFVEKQKLTEGADEVFVNGDSFIPKAKALESVFKSRMFGSL